MFEEIERLTRALCAEHGTSGCEGDVFKVAKKELGFCKEVCENELGGVVGIFGDLSSKRRILLDAHIDQIGMIVTDIDENGFLHVTNVDGVDRRTLPGSPVTVFGTETVTGIGCTLPPHLAKGDDKIKPVAEQCIDLGLPKEEVEKLVAVGDRAAQLANEQNPDCCVMVLCSTKEEVGGQGAQVSAYALEPTEAIAVDVSFAKQPDAESMLTAELGKGPMIGFSAALDRKISKKLVELAKRENIPYQLEAMGGRTGTNCDEISTTRGGVRTGLISVPQRNMHTPAEVCDFEDMENIAKLIAAYITDKEAQPNA